MENFQQKQTSTIRDDVDEMKAKVAKLLEEKGGNKKEKEKPWRPPFKWNFKFVQSKRAANSDKILVMMFNKKNQIEAPKFMPIFGNIIVWKNKVYVYRPKAIWTMMVLGKPQVYCIKEDDMEPISNISKEKLERLMVKSGRSTVYHKLLLQAALSAQVKKDTKQMNWLIAGIVILVVVGALIWFFTKG